MKHFTIIMLAFLLVFLSKGYSQNDDSGLWDEYWEPDSVAALSSSQPTIDILYGFGKPSFKEGVLTKSFASVNTAELKLGFTRKRTELFRQNAMAYKFTYFLISNLSTEWVSKASIGNNFNSDSWRLGFGLSHGYGYNFGETSDLILYNSGNVFWSKYHFKDHLDSMQDIATLKTIDDGSFRFGQSFEAGIKGEIFSPLSLNVAYERVIIYPRFMTWYWCGSEIMRGCGTALVEYFTHKVIRASTGAGPIVNFILINLYDYGAYELKKKYMDWPYMTAPPLMYDNFKFGLTFAF
jgi:hypothetical protein